MASRPLALALVAALVLVLVPPASADNPSQVGISSMLRWRDPDLEATARRTRAAGARWAREDFQWSRVEVRPGVYDWTPYDRMMGATARHDIRVLAILNSPPRWVQNPPTSDDALDGYIRFTRAAIRRYGTEGSFWRRHPELPRLPVRRWEIWNEPYVEVFWPTGPDPAEYARFFRDVVGEVEDLDDNARFLVEQGNSVAWLRQMLAAVPNLPAYMDAVAVHPYTGAQAPEVCTVENGRRRGFCRLLDVRDELARRGIRRPIWITEVGWPTSGYHSVSEHQQAENVHTVFRLLREWRAVQGLIWYSYWTDEADPLDREGWFGLVHRDGTPKPGWRAFRTEAPIGFTYR